MFPDKQNVQTYAQIPTTSKRSHSFLLAFIVSLILLLAVAGYAVWQYLDTANLKTDFDGEVTAAVAVQREEIEQDVQAQFDEEEKNPYKTSTFIQSLGGVTISYPKTWSIYSIERSSSSKSLQVYAYPEVVPDVSGDAAFAFRIEITDIDYDKVVKAYEKRVNSGDASARPYKSNGVLGTRFDGQLDSKTEGVLIALPLRDKTIKLWTEASKYKSDYLKVVESLEFQP